MGRRDRVSRFRDDSGSPNRVARADREQLPEMPAGRPLGYHVGELTLSIGVKDPSQARIIQVARRMGGRDDLSGGKIVQ
jgi:hypothetical protein